MGDYFAFCSLAPYFDNQRVLVGRTIVESLPRYYSDAVVTLSGAGGISSFRHTKNGVYEEVSPCLPIIGDSLYTLNVLFPDGHQIQAHTRVPGDFTILEPQPGDTLYFQIGPMLSPSTNAIMPFIEWTPSQHAYYYQADVFPEEHYGWDGVRTNYTRIFLPYYPFGTFVEEGIPTPPTSEYETRVLLKVTAIDSSRSFSPMFTNRHFLVLPSLDYEAGFNRIDEGNVNWINVDKLDFQGGKGFFNAVNQATCDFVLHVKVVE